MKEVVGLPCALKRSTPRQPQHRRISQVTNIAIENGFLAFHKLEQLSARRLFRSGGRKICECHPPEECSSLFDRARRRQHTVAKWSSPNPFKREGSEAEGEGKASFSAIARNAIAGERRETLNGRLRGVAGTRQDGETRILREIGIPLRELAEKELGTLHGLDLPRVVAGSAKAQAFGVGWRVRSRHREI